MDTYEANRWMDEAIATVVLGIPDRVVPVIGRLDPIKDIYRWRDPARHRETAWHQFQEAVKAHQDESWEILKQRNFQGLELPKL